MRAPCFAVLLAAAIAACGEPDAGGATAPACDRRPGSPALATCLAPRHPDAYYVDQALRYFDTLDTSASRESIPAYAALAARWEWRPWLLLTGYGRENLIYADLWVTRLSPSTVPLRDCRAFSVQPFARCRISFQYAGGLCPIYEEFTFNDQGETTFIEAWSDQPGLLPMADPKADPWGEGPDVRRLATKVPGLGNATGRIDLGSAAMREAAARDADVAEFARRAAHFAGYWVQELARAGGTDEAALYAEGCGW